MSNPIFDHKERSFDNRFIVVNSKGKFMDARSQKTRFMTQARIFFNADSALAGAASMNGLGIDKSWEAVAIKVTFEIK